MTEYIVDIILVCSYIAVIAVLTLIVVGVCRSVRLHSAVPAVGNGVRSGRIAVGVVVGMAAVFVLSYCFASARPVSVNGVVFEAAVWLRLTDMFIYSSCFLILLAVVLVIFGSSGLNRKWNNRKRRHKA